LEVEVEEEDDPLELDIMRDKRPLPPVVLLLAFARASNRNDEQIENNITATKSNRNMLTRLATSNKEGKALRPSLAFYTAFHVLGRALFLFPRDRSQYHLDLASLFCETLIIQKQLETAFAQEI